MRLFRGMPDANLTMNCFQIWRPLHFQPSARWNWASLRFTGIFCNSNAGRLHQQPSSLGYFFFRLSASLSGFRIHDFTHASNQSLDDHYTTMQHRNKLSTMYDFTDLDCSFTYPSTFSRHCTLGFESFFMYFWAYFVRAIEKKLCRCFIYGIIHCVPR